MALLAVNMRMLALLALLVAPCGSFMHFGAAPGRGLALRSLASPRGAQQTFCARQLVAAGQNDGAVGGLGAAQAQVVASRWRAESCVNLYMDGRAGIGGGRGSAGRGRGRGGGGADHAPSVGRGDGVATRPSGGRGGYRNPATTRGGPIDAARFTSVIKECSEVGELARVLQEQKGFLNHIHVSAAWMSLARMGKGRGGGDLRNLLSLLQDLTSSTLDRQGTWGIGNIFYSMARLRVPMDRGLLEVMQTRATATAGEFKTQEVANVLWALATMGEKADRGLLEAMQTRATATAVHYKPQEVANVLWALATMGARANLELLEAMQNRATATAVDFKPQEVANLLWALATMGEKADRGLLEAMQTRATAAAVDFKPQEVANLLWALATMGEKADQRLLVAMQTRATETVGGFIPQAISNMMWALATMGERADRVLLAVMQRRALATSGEFTPQAISNLMWGLATMGDGVDRVLLAAMQRRATAIAVDFTPQAVANLMWALASMGEKADRGLMEAMLKRASATAGEFYPQSVANLLWALAVMGDDLLEGNLAILVDRFAAKILELREEFTEVHKRQLHQWLLSCELGLAPGASLPKGVARVKKELGEASLQAFTTQPTRESQLQREVGAALESAGMEIEEEFRDARSGYSIDYLVRRRSGSFEEPTGLWAVEVDGPFHFLQDARTPSGSTLLKRRLLGLLGYTVVPVPFWEWNALRDESAQLRYVQDKLGKGAP